MPGKSVLIIDDSRIIAKRLEMMLKSIDNVGSIGHMEDYASAWQSIERQQPDIVLLDINLPGGSGINLLQKIKERYPSIVVIMITNQDNDSYRVLCTKLGAAWFIDKSRDFEKIPALISSLP